MCHLIQGRPPNCKTNRHGHFSSVTFPMLEFKGYQIAVELKPETHQNAWYKKSSIGILNLKSREKPLAANINCCQALTQDIGLPTLSTYAMKLWFLARFADLISHRIMNLSILKRIRLSLGRDSQANTRANAFVDYTFIQTLTNKQSHTHTQTQQTYTKNSYTHPPIYTTAHTHSNLQEHTTTI